MTLDQIFSVSQIAAALAVVASLFFVGLQLRQSDRTQRAGSLQSVLDGYRDRTFLPGITSAEVASIWARGLTSIDLLTANERIRFWWILLNEFLHMQHVVKLRELKMIEPVDYDAWIAYTASLVKAPGAAALWPMAKTVITPTVSAVIDTHLARNPNQPSFIELNPLFVATASERGVSGA
jgi:hypothetical protein